MNKEVKAIIFDIGGVLQVSGSKRKNQKQKHSSGIHEKAAKKLGLDLDQYFDSIDSYYAKSIEGKISKNELLKNISFNLKISPEKLEKLYYNLYKKQFKINKGLIKKVKFLKKKGYKVAILSDQWHLSRKANFPKKLEKLFKYSLISCDVGARKPNPKIYDLLLKKLKLKPSQIIFIDNQRWNLKPAKKLGIKTILYKNNEQLFKNKLWKGLF